MFREADCMNAAARYRLCIRIVGTSAKAHAINPNNMKLGRKSKLFHRERFASAKEIAESMKLENLAQDVKTCQFLSVSGCVQFPEQSR